MKSLKQTQMECLNILNPKDHKERELYKALISTAYTDGYFDGRDAERQEQRKLRLKK